MEFDVLLFSGKSQLDNPCQLLSWNLGHVHVKPINSTSGLAVSLPANLSFGRGVEMFE